MLNASDIAKKALVAVAGLVAAFTLLEFGLFAAARVYTAGAYAGRGADEAGAGRARTVLCLGDSFTFGNGAPEGFDYPAQLGRLIAEAGFDCRVVNRGIVGGTTRRRPAALPTP